MAAGGSMAIEDAAILSRCLTEFDDPAAAFALLRGYPHPTRRRRAAHLDREQLDAWRDRDRLVLRLRRLHARRFRV